MTETEFATRRSALILMMASMLGAADSDEPELEALPLTGLRAEQLVDTFHDGRDDNARTHEAIDLMTPRGTPVHAVADGIVEKLFFSEAGGNTIYQFDRSQKWCYYYAHLDRYEKDLKEEQSIKAGDRLGFAGSSGNARADAPHLHFSILRLGSSKKWWRETEAVNPYPYLLRLLEQRRPSGRAGLPESLRLR